MELSEGGGTNCHLNDDKNIEGQSSSTIMNVNDDISDISDMLMSTKEPYVEYALFLRGIRKASLSANNLIDNTTTSDGQTRENAAITPSLLSTSPMFGSSMTGNTAYTNLTFKIVSINDLFSTALIKMYNVDELNVFLKAFERELWTRACDYAKTLADSSTTSHSNVWSSNTVWIYDRHAAFMNYVNHSDTIDDVAYKTSDEVTYVKHRIQNMADLFNIARPDVVWRLARDIMFSIRAKWALLQHYGPDIRDFVLSMSGMTWTDDDDTRFIISLEDGSKIVIYPSSTDRRNVHIRWIDVSDDAGAAITPTDASATANNLPSSNTDTKS